MPASPTTRLDDVERPRLVLGRYRVLGEGEHGGFGTVSVCWDPRLMRKVAIKTISLRPRGTAVHRDDPSQTLPGDDLPSAMRQRQAQSLLRAALAETRTASMLAHPNIVSMLDFESDEDYAYIIMEYVEGASLAQLLDGTDDHLLTFDEAAAVVTAVSDALSHAHDNGVLHLDIKPDNILVDGSGRVRLADFGMASLSSATGYGGAVGGTVGYMPPEQIMGGQVDVRTDVFAFACVVYEALTGVRPFHAANAADSLELVLGVHPDPCALNEDIPPQVADVLLAAIDADPEARPASVSAFARELRAGLGGSARAGRASLAALVEQVTNDEGDAADDDDQDQAQASPYERWETDELGPLAMASPGLFSWALRITSALACGFLTYATALAWSATLSGPASAIAGGVVVAALTLAAPQLGSALALVSMVVALFCAQQLLAAPLVCLTCLAWWVTTGRWFAQASGLPLAGSVAGAVASPLAAQLSGLLLTPLRAASSAGVAFVTALCLCALAGQSHIASINLDALATTAPDAVTQAFIDLLTTPSTWVFGIGWVLAGTVLSLCATNGARWRCYLGCAASFCILALQSGILASMENDWTWTLPSAEQMSVAVSTSILMCAIVFLFGTPRRLVSDEADGKIDMGSSREDQR